MSNGLARLGNFKCGGCGSTDIYYDEKRTPGQTTVLTVECGKCLRRSQVPVDRYQGIVNEANNLRFQNPQ